MYLFMILFDFIIVICYTGSKYWCGHWLVWPSYVRCCYGVCFVTPICPLLLWRVWCDSHMSVVAMACVVWLTRLCPLWLWRVWCDSHMSVVAQSDHVHKTVCALPSHVTWCSGTTLCHVCDENTVWHLLFDCVCYCTHNQQLHTLRRHCFFVAATKTQSVTPA